MKTIIRLREGENIPEGAVYLKSVEELDPKKTYTQWETTPGFWGSIPIFGTETKYRYTPSSMFHYYEVTLTDSE